MYAECTAGTKSAPPWWTAVVVTASSGRQAERYEWEIHRRKDQGKLPPGARYLVVPDLRDRRMGSGGATLNALRQLEAQWANERVLVIHAGGESRRLPQYSLTGKLFSALPVKTPWGEVSTVFDELLALSTAWVERLPAGLVVGSGDVLLTFDAAELDFSRPGVTGVAMRQPGESAAQHGVYIADEQGRVYAYLQKPSLADVKAAGGLLENEQVALDAGLLRFDPESAARLARIELAGELPVMDLYQHVTMALTGQWTPQPGEAPVLHHLATALRGVPFWCSTVSGEFTHIGTTTLFRRLITGETEFSRLYAVKQRLGAVGQPGLRSAGVVIDSVLAGGGEVGPGAVVIECSLSAPVRAARGSVLHGLEGMPGLVEAPEDTVIHQVPVALPDGRRGVVIRVFGVADDPNAPAAAWKATWLGRPMIEELRGLGMDLAKVWPGRPAEEWTLWNAQLFPMGALEEAWSCAQWLLRLSNGYSVEQWSRQERLALASSAEWADQTALAAAHTRRLQANWKSVAVSLAAAGSDIRPLLAHAPGIGPLTETAQTLAAQAGELEAASPTESASRYFQAGLFFGQAGLASGADAARESAFRMVERAVRAGSYGKEPAQTLRWQHQEVTVEGPARIDLGGGWSDTPPFCLDWGGTVLNVAVELDGGYPIHTTVRRIDDRVVRADSGEGREGVEFRSSEELLRPAFPGDPFSIPRTALRMTGVFREEEALEATLERMGGGIEIATSVRLPMGSGLGTSSILAATMLRALSEMLGLALDDQGLGDQVMRLEQLMTTGGGWQDQAGGIFPGAKLVTSGPGLHQRLRVQPMAWTAEREAEFESLLVLYYTGIRRIAKGLLQHVVGSYLARENATLQVLHSIKTLAMEMAHAMQDGEWDYLGRLLDRHWELNKLLDPHTANAPINALLEVARPRIRGAKLAGAGGGGFLMLLARGPEAAAELRAALAPEGGAVSDWKIARAGLRILRR